ncbi:YcxB family protein [Bacillus horti]|uniref:YcxB-like C-terminal domain-containing protein n=1 Tax=Caldalkalibacillus horti TaxID=77523 RepID=A0ABT9VXL7_9BACI|nr:YcxB family protein [Bacillus horti]MDQ0165619.1 hypothetical protein [Bacillus horti]
MRIAATITKEDYWNFNKFTMFHIPKARTTMLLSLHGFPVIIFVVLSFIGIPLLYRIGASIVLGAVVDGILIYFIKHRIMSLVEGSKGLLGEHTFEINETGFKESTEVNQSEYSWDGVSSIEQDKHNIYLFIGKVQVHIIPKKSFSTKEEGKQFFQKMKDYRRAASTH